MKWGLFVQMRLFNLFSVELAFILAIVLATWKLLELFRNSHAASTAP